MSGIFLNLQLCFGVNEDRPKFLALVAAQSLIVKAC